MNTLKRTLALVATLAMASTAFASCGSDDSSFWSSSSSFSTAANRGSQALQRLQQPKPQDATDAPLRG